MGVRARAPSEGENGVVPAGRDMTATDNHRLMDYTVDTEEYDNRDESFHKCVAASAAYSLVSDTEGCYRSESAIQ